ncbi:MAG: alpha/beta hydrolase [Roseburia sp.]|nr:alpha/beta hydrolase [Roseburia sp.]
MLTEKFDLLTENSISAKLYTYIQDSSKDLMVKKRPLMLICPGGGYNHLSDRETEPLAVRFLAMGFHVAVLRYSVTPAVFPTALLELAQAMKLVHDYADEWNVDAEKIFVLGCSAGGHLAASLGVYWQEDWLAQQSGVKKEWLRPAGMVLCYPVITSGEFAHRGSFDMLMRGQESEELLEKLSLEKHVTAQTPETFIWHTASDASVPVENSLLFVSELHKNGVPVEFHMYPVGKHGLSTADELSQNSNGTGLQPECTSWLPLVQTWLKGRAW